MAKAKDYTTFVCANLLAFLGVAGNNVAFKKA